MTRRGFTLSVVPHAGGRRKSLDVSGVRLLVFTVVVVLSLLVVLGALGMLLSGLTGWQRLETLEEENLALRDSLTGYREVRERLDGIEAELQRIRERRIRIENLAGLAESMIDSL